MKTVYEERELVEKAIPSGGNNFWPMANFSVCFSSRFRPGGLFTDYDLQKLAQLSASIEERNAVN